MKVLYGTSNMAKLSVMKKRLRSIDIEIIGLKDLNVEIPNVPEDGITPLENARQKAKAYYELFHMPVFSCDSGLYFDNVPDEIQPGVHVRTVNGKYLTDYEMITHYSSLAAKYGDLTAKYKNAICFISDEDHCYEAMDSAMESEKFIITSKPHDILKKGFPLDSISVDIASGEYYYDLPEDELDQVAVEDGFLEFFKKIMSNEERKDSCNGKENYPLKIDEAKGTVYAWFTRMEYRGGTVTSDLEPKLTLFEDKYYDKYQRVGNEIFTELFSKMHSKIRQFFPIDEVRNRETYLWFEKDELVGSISIHHNKLENCYELERVMVATQAQGKGYGKKLLKFAVAKLQQAHHTPIFLTVAACNDKAARMYERFGFVAVREEMEQWEIL